jgi:hypothetical protein
MNPRGYPFPVSLRTWIADNQLGLLLGARPFIPAQFPNPRASRSSAFVKMMQGIPLALASGVDQYTVSGRSVQDLFTPAALSYPSHVTRQTN